jgi:hypothetical protein
LPIWRGREVERGARRVGGAVSRAGSGILSVKATVAHAPTFSCCRCLRRCAHRRRPAGWWS